MTAAEKQADLLTRKQAQGARLRLAAADLCANPENEELWRELCSARATLRALARCAR